MCNKSYYTICYLLLMVMLIQLLHLARIFLVLGRKRYVGKYHSHAEEIPAIGRELMPPTGYQIPLSTLQGMLKPGEVLVGYYDALFRKLALVLEQQAQLD